MTKEQKGYKVQCNWAKPHTPTHKIRLHKLCTLLTPTAKVVMAPMFTSRTTQPLTSHFSRMTHFAAVFANGRSSSPWFEYFCKALKLSIFRNYEPFYSVFVSIFISWYFSISSIFYHNCIKLKIHKFTKLLMAVFKIRNLYSG